ncbi:MAG: thioredoxin family protein [Pontixanthobacter sp.]
MSPYLRARATIRKRRLADCTFAAATLHAAQHTVRRQEHAVPSGAHHLLLRIVLGWLCALTVLGAPPAYAQGSPNNLQATLIAEGAAVPGETAYLAIHFSPVSDEWHGYWRNPGDAGYGMELDWSLPAGWQAGEPLYPVPQRLLIGGLMNHIYEGDYAVLIPVEVPADAAIGAIVPVSVEAQWLACTDAICVPEQAVLSANVRVADRLTPNARFDEWRAAIPPVLDSQARFAVRDSTLALAIPLPATATPATPHVYIANIDLVRYAADQRFARKGNWLVADIPLAANFILPDAIEGIMAFDTGQGVRFAAIRGQVPTDGEPLTNASPTAPNLPWLFLAALAGGLLLNIMPCVFPILSLKALSLARAGTDETQARREGVAYSAGVILACVALGGLMLALRAGGEQIGWAFQLQEPWVVVALLILAAAITANLAGLFELPSFAITRGGEPASAFATGLLAAIAATPCTGPFMAAALGAALLLPVGPALLLFASLGLGLALPFLLIAIVPALRRSLPKPGQWMERFRKFLAIPMGLTALALIWLVSRLGGQAFAMIALLTVVGVLGALAVTGSLQRHGKLAWPAFGLIAAPFALFGAFALPASYDARAETGDRSILTPKAYSPETLARARDTGQPVFLWFTADWCLTCKVNEGAAIEREATRKAFEEAGVIAIRGDWTQRDAEITRYLTEQGVAGIPLYVWYTPDGEKQVLPQVLTPNSLVDLAQSVGANDNDR